MTIAQTDQPTARKPLRPWPGVAAGVLLLLVRFGVPAVMPDEAGIGVIGGLLVALAIVVWWAFFSRAPGWERWGAIVLMIVGLAATSRLIDESIATGMMGMMFYIYAIPVVSLTLVGWAVACRRLADGPRRAALAAAIVLACGVWTLLRTDGILGAGGSQFAWRWTPTAEQRLLAQSGDEPLLAAGPTAAATVAPPPLLPEVTSADPNAADAKIDAKARSGDEPAVVPAASGETAGGLAAERSGEPAWALHVAQAEADWPGFRGPNRDGRIPGLRIETDWSKSPPVELWRRPVGPGWSSFAIHGNLLYTQEQRGDDEVVSCYNLASGEPVWRHGDAARFWESNAGAGPRATPTLSGGRVYSFGATAILNALDARTGAVAWTRNAASDTATKVPYWGFASSPLVAGDLVIVATAGQLAAYNLATGEPRWKGPAHGDGYSSPQRLTIGGVPQILLLSSRGATSVAPADGALLWEHDWQGFASLQPALIAGGDLLITTGNAMGGLGSRRLAVTHRPGKPMGEDSSPPDPLGDDPAEQGSSLPRPASQSSGLPGPASREGWTVEERWTSRGLKPYFNDFVVHEGHAYGFDGRILSCIDLAGGERKWKGGRYGNGQLVLLPDQDLLLVLSDEGELALVAAAPAGFSELARFQAIEGKTWNHPALAGDVLLVRNDREMAAFRLALLSR
jgi:hypothetical protein